MAKKYTSHSASPQALMGFAALLGVVVGIAFSQIEHSVAHEPATAKAQEQPDKDAQHVRHE